MDLRLIDASSLLIKALMEGAGPRKKIVEAKKREENQADRLCGAPEQLAELVNGCFWASLSTEEGRPVRGSLCVCSPDEVHGFITFESPILVSLKNLVSLFTASPDSSLGVHAGEKGPEIWGILEALPVHSLKLRVAAIGTVIVSQDQQILVVIQGGKVHLPKNAGAYDVIRAISKALKLNAPQERLPLVEKFLRVIGAMHQHGHGGALVIVPKLQRSWEKDVSFASRFTKEGVSRLREIWSEAKLAEQEVEALRGDLEVGRLDPLLPTLRMRQEIADAKKIRLDSALRRIGALSAVDGALVMTDDLGVVGFGAKLITRPESFVLKAYDALNIGPPRETPLDKIGGTRHQSAARFVQEHQDSMVVVASQDGRLTLFLFVRKLGIAMIKHLEHFIWEYDT